MNIIISKKNLVLINLITIILVFVSCTETIDKLEAINEGENKVDYYENGNIKHEGIEINNKYHGKHIWYYQNGQKEIDASRLPPYMSRDPNPTLRKNSFDELLFEFVNVSHEKNILPTYWFKIFFQNTYFFSRIYTVI